MKMQWLGQYSNITELLNSKDQICWQNCPERCKRSCCRSWGQWSGRRRIETSQLCWGFCQWLLGAASESEAALFELLLIHGWEAEVQLIQEMKSGSASGMHRLNSISWELSKRALSFYLLAEWKPTSVFRYCRLSWAIPSNCRCLFSFLVAVYCTY